MCTTASAANGNSRKISKKIPTYSIKDKQFKRVSKTYATRGDAHLNPVEFGILYTKMMKDMGLKTKRELAKRIGVSESTIGQKIATLKLPAVVIDDMLTGNGINDQKVLKCLRQINSKNLIVSTYFHMKNSRMNRGQMVEYIQKIRNKEKEQR